LRRLLFVIAALVLIVVGYLVWAMLTPAPRPIQPAAPAPTAAAVARPSIAANAIAASATAAPAAADCNAPAFDQAASANAASLETLAWQPFHRNETGWRTYAPHIAVEIGVACPADSSGFAAALGAWQGGHGLPPTGRLDPATFDKMNIAWELARPFVRLSQTGVCPDPPANAALAWARPEEGYERKPIQLRADALAAYRRLVAAARSASPAIAADPRLLTIFSGYRSPESDSARCATENNCGNVTRALCSAHRTGLAMDLYLGAAPGFPPESSDDANRLYQSQTAAYAWLVAHGTQYGFVNYPFEPWHWEWVG
jgi:zinc D-Ala-D-Ala carboxypeptidase